jgi:hypothetical protein
MSNDEYKRILLQVMQELKDQGWSDEDIADADIRITESSGKQYVGFNGPATGAPPARWDKYAPEEHTPAMVSDLMANTGLKYKIKGVYKS